MRALVTLCIALLAAPVAAQADLAARCSQLVSYYARYGSGRNEDADGTRNFVRLGAEIDCQNGRYEKGIAALEALMKGRNWVVPPPRP